MRVAELNMTDSSQQCPSVIASVLFSAPSRSTTTGEAQYKSMCYSSSKLIQRTGSRAIYNVINDHTNNRN